MVSMQSESHSYSERVVGGGVQNSSCLVVSRAVQLKAFFSLAEIREENMMS